MLSLGRAIGSPFFTLYEKEENENMNYGNSYNSNPNANPYLSNNIYQTPYSSASPYNNNNTLGTQFSPQNNTQQMTNQVDTMNYVSKEDYDKLLNEKRKLQEQLENEMAQRVDIEFFKKEQEIMRLPEGQRLIQELDYQKNQFFEAFWRTSDSGKEAMKKYRESVNLIYDRYRQGDMGQQTVHSNTVAEEETVF